MPDIGTGVGNGEDRVRADDASLFGDEGDDGGFDDWEMGEDSNGG